MAADVSATVRGNPTPTADAEALSWRNCTVTLGALQPWERNPRQLTQAQAERLADSFERQGER